MVRFYVDTSYVGAIYHLFTGYEPLAEVLGPEPVFVEGDWRSVSVGDLLKECWNVFFGTDSDDDETAQFKTEVLGDVEDAIRDFGEAYFLDSPYLVLDGGKPICSFRCSPSDAKNALALHTLAPHGVLIDRSRRPIHKEAVVLPDLLFGIRFLAVPGGDPIRLMKLAMMLSPSATPFLSALEVHLCDTLADAVGRILALPKRIRRFISRRRTSHEFDTANTFLFLLEKEIAASELGTDNSGQVCILPQLFGCPGLRSLREQKASAVPLIANHRLLSSAVLRQGLGKRFSSAVWQVSLWRKLKAPIKTVLLQAAEVAAGAVCRPVYPMVPTPTIMMELLAEAEEMELSLLSIGADVPGEQDDEGLEPVEAMTDNGSDQVEDESAAAGSQADSLDLKQASAEG